MHGTLPLSEQQALASLREGKAAGMSPAALAREWGWSRGKVRQRLDGWRRNGDLPQPPKRRATRRTLPAAVVPRAAAPVSDPVALPTKADAACVPVTGRFGRLLGTAILASVGLALAAIGMVETTSYSLR